MVKPQSSASRRDIATFNSPFPPNPSMNHALKICLAVMLSAVSSFAIAAGRPAVPKKHVLHRYQLGQAGGWDYMSYDEAGRRVFIGRSGRVWAIDADTGTVSGEIQGTEGVHGIAIAPEFSKGFTSDGKTNTVTVFDLLTLQIRQKIALSGERPDAILYDPASRHVLTFNAKTTNVSVIDAESEQEVATIPLNGTPEFAVADGEGHVYLNIESTGSVAMIDTRESKVIATWSLGDCEEPTGIALDKALGLTFSTCQNGKMVALSTRTGKVVANLPIDMGPDAAAFDPKRNLLYSSNGQAGTLSVYRVDGPARFHRLPTITTQKSARTMALDVEGNRIFLAAAEFATAPEPTADQPHPRPPMIPDTFTILVVQ